MASPALNSFNAFVDGLSINNANKTAAKNRGQQLYQEAIREAAAHVKLHADAELAGTVDSDELRVLQFLSDVQTVFAAKSDFHASDLAVLVAPNTTAEDKWGQALGSIFGAATIAQASRIFDVWLLRYDTAGVRTRLLAFRDLVTAKLGP